MPSESYFCKILKYIDKALDGPRPATPETSLDMRYVGTIFMIVPGFVWSFKGIREHAWFLVYSGPQMRSFYLWCTALQSLSAIIIYKDGNQVFRLAAIANFRSLISFLFISSSAALSLFLTAFIMVLVGWGEAAPNPTESSTSVDLTTAVCPSSLEDAIISTSTTVCSSISTVCRAAASADSPDQSLSPQTMTIIAAAASSFVVFYFLFKGLRNEEHMGAAANPPSLNSSTVNRSNSGSSLTTGSDSRSDNVRENEHADSYELQSFAPAHESNESVRGDGPSPRRNSPDNVAHRSGFNRS